MTAVPRGPQVKRLVDRSPMAKAADWQLRGFKLEPKRSRHMNLGSADTLFNTSVEFVMDRDEAVISDDASSSQADEAAVSEVSLRELFPPEGCGWLG